MRGRILTVRVGAPISKRRHPELRWESGEGATVTPHFQNRRGRRGGSCRRGRGGVEKGEETVERGGDVMSATDMGGFDTILGMGCHVVGEETVGHGGAWLECVVMGSSPRCPSLSGVARIR
jgi:hypothetical protein